MIEQFPGAYVEYEIDHEAATYIVLHFSSDGGERPGEFLLLLGFDLRPEQLAATYCTCCAMSAMAKDIVAFRGSRPVFVRFGRINTPLKAVGARALLRTIEKVGHEFFDRLDRDEAEHEAAVAVKH